MIQSKKHSHYEVVSNQAIGLIVGFLIVYYIFPLMNALNQAELATASTIIFFIASYVRAYTIRRIFNGRRR